MCCFLQFIFWGSFLAIVYTYLGYPLLLRWLSRGKQLNTLCFNETALPQVTVLMAVHNEEKVIAEKITTLLHQDYPAKKITISIGSDNSSDATNDIVEQFAKENHSIQFIAFPKRQGKPGIINQLAAKATTAKGANENHIFIITDASVMLGKNVIRELVKHFKTPNLAIVDACMTHVGMNEDTISASEDNYISWEGKIKLAESILWKKMIGPFGGCYALRSDFYHPIPDNFLVDDFYITMKAFQKRGLAINEPKAVCYEPVGHEISEEFRRKSRISAGNMQNLFMFRKLWFPPIGMPNFAFFSHKVLRWLGPIWIMAMLVTTFLLLPNPFYALLFVGLIGFVFLIPVLDFFFQKAKINLLIFRHIRYFVLMNLALLVGMVNFFKGVRTNIWQPPKRH